MACLIMLTHLVNDLIIRVQLILHYFSHLTPLFSWVVGHLELSSLACDSSIQHF